MTPNTYMCSEAGKLKAALIFMNHMYQQYVIEVSAAHRIQRAWGNGILGAPVTRKCNNLLNYNKKLHIKCG
jgi:hypothetical protein